MKAKKREVEKETSLEYDTDALVVSSHMLHHLFNEFSLKEGEQRSKALTKPYTMVYTMMQAWTQIKLNHIVHEPTESNYQKTAQKSH